MLLLTSCQPQQCLPLTLTNTPLHTCLIIVKQTERFDGLLFRIPCVHFRRHHLLESLEGNGAVALLPSSAHAGRKGRLLDFGECAAASRQEVRRHVLDRIRRSFSGPPRASARTPSHAWPLSALCIEKARRERDEALPGSKYNAYAPSESIVPESSVSKSLNASRISSSWSEVSAGDDIRRGGSAALQRGWRGGANLFYA